MSPHVIFPAPSARGKPRDYGWEFASDYRVALKIKDGTADPSTPAQALGPKISREALDRSLAAGEEKPTAPYFYVCTENYNPTDPREVDFDAWYGPEPASGGGWWGATGWYKAMPEQPVVEVMPSGVLLGCAWRGDAEGCRSALAHGANPNFRDGSTSVLSAAIEEPLMEVLELLIGAGLNSDQGYDVEWLVQPLVETGERALLKRLLSFLRPPKNRWSRLLGVCANPAIAELLEAHGASVEGAVVAGYFPLRDMLNINERRPRPERLDRVEEMVRWLVSRGADVNAAGEYGGTALASAVWRWEVPAIRALLAHGADPYLVSDGSSALAIADEKGQQAAFHALVEECWNADHIITTELEPVDDVEPFDSGLVGKCEDPAGQALEEPSRKPAFFASSANRDAAVGSAILAAGGLLALVSNASTWPAPGYAVAVGAIALGAWKLFRALLNSAAHSGKGTSAFPVVRAVKARQVSGAIHGDGYPSSALRAGAEGRCVVGFTVDVTGRVNDVQLVKSSGYRALDEAACNFIAKRFQFEPARGSDGVAIAERRQQPVVWRLPHDSSAEPI